MSAPLAVVDRNVTATGTPSVNLTSTASLNYESVVVTFKDAAAPTVPILVQRTAGAGANGSTTPAVQTLPVAPTAGNLMLSWTCGKAGATASLTGWTSVDTLTDGANCGVTILQRTVVGGDGTSYSFVLSSGQRWGGGLAEFTDLDATTPINQHTGAQNSGARTVDTTTSITPTVDNCMILSAFGVGTGAVNGTAPSSPVSEWFDAANTTTSTSGRLVLHEQQQGTAAAITDSVTWSGSTSVIGYDQVIALAPAVSAAAAVSLPPYSRPWRYVPKRRVG